MGNKSFIRYIKASFNNKNTKNMELLKQIRFKNKNKKRKRKRKISNSSNKLILEWNNMNIHINASISIFKVI